MPTIAVDDRVPIDPCTHDDHAVPAAKGRSPGKYVHECPGCGNVSVFVVNARYEGTIKVVDDTNGRVAERLKAPASKAGGPVEGSAGSNPAPSS